MAVILIESRDKSILRTFKEGVLATEYLWEKQSRIESGKHISWSGRVMHWLIIGNNAIPDNATYRLTKKGLRCMQMGVEI